MLKLKFSRRWLLQAAKDEELLDSHSGPLAMGPLRIFTSEEELELMIRNREILVQKLGKEKYDRMVELLKKHISSRADKK